MKVCLVLIIAVGTQLVVAAGDVAAPATPVFAPNYHVQGVISLPYAELNEPFSAWYDKNNTRSRTDYYGDLYKVYQFGPQSAPEPSAREYGSLYKLVYVPSSFHLQAEHNQSSHHQHHVVGDLVEKVRDRLAKVTHRHAQPAADSTTGGDESSKTLTKRACFAVKGSVGSTIAPQTVLPSLADFTFESTGDCPRLEEHLIRTDAATTSARRKRAKCELWKLITTVGDKSNHYKMWIKRDETTGAVVPVRYYMLGYDSLLGSHYDRYDIIYYNYQPYSARDKDFFFDTESYKCGSMPGPGDSEEESRLHMVVQNPIHEYVIEPHRYDHVDHEFDKFAREHEKDYESVEHHRKGWKNFLHNFRFINGKNRELKSYKLKVNRFADNDPRELRYLRGRMRSKGYNGGLDYEKHHNLKGASGKATVAQLPDTWDWSVRGAVTPVKDQAVCGSCWSFGTSGTVEGAYFVKTGKLPRLSQQQMVDCSWKFGNNGCDGGEDFRAYQYIMEAGGLATEEDYGSYMGVDGKCHDRDVKKVAKISGFYNVTANDPEALKHALITYGPVTVAIDASRPTFTFYSHGVYYDEKCNKSPDGLDHQVLVVGYTYIDGKFVWQVKNSWSTYWGNNGYIMMSAENNNCGLMDAPTVPIIQV